MPKKGFSFSSLYSKVTSYCKEVCVYFPFNHSLGRPNTEILFLQIFEIQEKKKRKVITLKKKKKRYWN